MGKNYRNLIAVRKNQLSAIKARMKEGHSTYEGYEQDQADKIKYEDEIAELEAEIGTRKPNTSHFGEKYDYMHILADEDGSFTVKGYGTYGRSSVLAGQVKICFVDSFDTLEEAEAEYPEATMSNQYMEPLNTFDHLPDGPDDGSLGWGSGPEDY
jgi:hypothetical protein